MLYIARSGQRPSKQQIRFEKLTLYTAVVCPLFLWHGDPDGRFTWFNVSERFVFTTPSVCLPLVRALYAAVPCAYAAAEFRSWRRGAAPNCGKLFIMAATYLTWALGTLLDHQARAPAFTGLRPTST